MVFVPAPVFMMRTCRQRRRCIAIGGEAAISVDKLAIHRIAPAEPNLPVPAVRLRHDFLRGSPVIYANVRDVEEVFAKLPPEVKDEFERPLEEAQGQYRRVWQQEPLNEEKRIEVLCQLAADVFGTRAVRRLRNHSGDSATFRSAISLEGGDAELGFWYAHRLYNIVERGRMLGTWHRQIESHLWGWIDEGENLWYNPDLMPERWNRFLGEHSTLIRQSAEADGHPETSAAEARQSAQPPAASNGAPSDRRAPADFFEKYQQNSGITYDQMAARIGISRDTLFKIKEERSWVRPQNYSDAAQLLGCQPVDLYPRNLPRLRRRKRKRNPHTQAGTPPKTQT